MVGERMGTSEKKYICSRENITKKKEKSAFNIHFKYKSIYYYRKLLVCYLNNDIFCLDAGCGFIKWINYSTQGYL